MIKTYKTIGFTLEERQFIQDILDDPRAWDQEFVDITEKLDKQPDIYVHKASGKEMQKIYPFDHLQGLSLCDTSKYPTEIYIRKENWDEGRGGYQNVWGYRAYVILHEFGHSIGYRHVKCPKAGEPAPVMMQQTKGTSPCYPDPWVKKY